MTTDGVSVHYRGRVALSDVSVTLGPGLTALVGPNGSGKTTFLRALATLVPVTGGAVRVFGHDVSSTAGAAAARRELGFLPQRARGLDHLRVVDGVTYAAWLKGVPRSDRTAAVTVVLADLGLKTCATQLLGTLSGGTLQRARIAQTVVHRPRLVLLDEPTVGLDAQHRDALRGLLRELARERAVVLSTHLAQDVEHADRVIALDGGTLAFHGTPQQLASLATSAANTLSATAQAIERGLRSLGSA